MPAHIEGVNADAIRREVIAEMRKAAAMVRKSMNHDQAGPWMERFPGAEKEVQPTHTFEPAVRLINQRVLLCVLDHAGEYDRTGNWEGGPGAVRAATRGNRLFAACPRDAGLLRLFLQLDHFVCRTRLYVKLLMDTVL